MASLKDIKQKITGIKKTEQITKAMNMVAAAKFRGAQERMEEFRPYAGKFSGVMGQLSATANPNAFPLMEEREIKKSMVLVVTSDRGLCGAFNANIISAAEQFLEEKKSQGIEVAVGCIGRKGHQYFSKKDIEVTIEIVDCMAKVEMVDARTAGKECIRLFLDGEIDEVHLLFGRFVNVVTQKPTFKKLIPISAADLTEAEAAEEEQAGPKATYIYEPDPEEILNILMPMYVNVQIMAAMLETACSEQAARMTAMDNATRACTDMIHELTLAYNKARQASITAELMDIVGGAEALKG
ncbi:MAG: ATP synthase F1 subunit gamma [Thermodesulfobacteria bacterium]|nr:ATP synthase F1 subunit gamma [Thermodesulfobacteriota bacterium]